MTQLTELDYESIENAVMETARGRWFLSEHKKRHGGSDTPAILEAIAKLEKVITSININDKTDVQECAPVAANPAPAFAPAVVNIPASNKPTEIQATPAKTTPVSDENMQFFSNDEDLFADDGDTFLSDAPVVESVENPQAEEPAVSLNLDEPAKTNGDRFKIFKTAPAKVEAEDEQASIETDTPVGVPEVSMQATEQEKDRIVVIRNTAGEDISIPLADEFAESSEADKSAAN